MSKPFQMLLCLLPIQSYAAEVPASLHNKTISISFTATANATAEDGTSASLPRHYQRTIYISSKGRLFSRTDRQAGRRRDTIYNDPNTTSQSYRFDGNRIVSASAALSGARQTVITFDSDFQRCSVSVIAGREADKAYKFVGLNGKKYTAIGSPKISSPTCSIREGNPF